MTRRIHVVVGLAGTILNVVGIVCLLRWAAKTDFLFGHYKGPAIYIVTALWTSLIGVIATVAWFLIRLYGKLASRRSPTVKPAFRTLTLFQGITLGVLLLPACLTVLIGVAKFPAARVQLKIDRMKSGAASPAELIKGLRSSEPDVRVAAARGLAKIGPEAKPAVAALAEALKDVKVRSSAARALGAIGPDAEPAIPALVEVVKEGTLWVSYTAARALGQIGPAAEPAIPALVEAARRGKRISKSGHEDDLLWKGAIRALGRIGPASLPALKELLKDENVFVRRRAARAIGMMGSKAKAAVPELAGALKDEDEGVRQRARVALERIDPNWNRTVEPE